MRKPTAVAIVIAMTLTPHPAMAFSFGVEAGIDKPTRKLLKSYPALLQKHIIGTLREALPLYKDGVDFTFNRIDKTVSEAFSQLECIQASLPPTTADATPTLSTFVFGRKRYRGRAATDLQKTASEDPKSIKSDTSPDSASLIYLDVLGTAHATSCYYRAQSPDSLTAITRIESDIKSRQRIWNFLMGLDCRSAQRCYGDAHRFVGGFIAATDPRDAASADAVKRLAALPKPDQNAPNGFARPWRVGDLLDGGFDLKTYEAHVRTLSAIQFDISAQTIQRTAKAVALLDTYDAKLRGYESRNRALSDAYRSRSSRTIADAFKEDKAQKLLRDVRGLEMTAPLSLSDAEIVADKLAGIARRQNRVADSTNSMIRGYQDKLRHVLSREQPRDRGGPRH